MNMLSLTATQGGHAIQARHRTVDGHRPEPAQTVGTPARLIDAPDLPLAGKDGVVRPVLVDAGAETERIREAGMPQIFYVTAATAPKSASLRVFLPINDQQTVPLESTQTYLQGSKH